MTRTRLCAWIVVCLGFMGVALCQSHMNFVQRRSASIHSGMRPPPKILTALSEIVINANENLTLICEADEPITWTYPKMNATMESSSTIELEFKPGKKLRYGAYLRMYISSFDDTGFHYCQYNDTSDSSNPNASANIYVYVRDEENLFTHSDVYVINGHQHQTLIIPCKPTSPDVHVVLKHDHGELASSDNATGRFSYDKRYGFSLRNFNTADGHRYECTASLKHTTQDLLIFVHFLPKTENAPKPYVNASSYGHVIGGKLELNCYFEREDTVAVGSSWIIPDVSFRRARIANTPFLKEGQPPNREMTISTLTIEETTFDDSGIYTCVTRDHNNNMNNDSIEIKILEQGTSYINLTESTNQYTLDVTDEIGTVQWKVDVDAYPPVTLQWYDNNQQMIVSHTGWPEDMMTAKYSVRSTKKETILKITRVGVEDNGVYQLKASNDINETTKNFTLRVSAKPLVDIQEKEDYHMVNRSTIIKCRIIAYPKPEVRWYFKPCLHDTCGAKSLRRIDKAYYNSTSRDPQGFTLESVLNITARESGEISCEAENKNGKDINTHQFLVTDVRRGCDVWHSNEGEPVAAGDNLTLVCGASKYNFTDSFYWYFQSNTETNKRIEKLYDVVQYSTMYSYRSNFTIANIGHNQSGTYECRNRDEHTTCSRVTVEVKDPKPPVFYKTNLNNTDLTMDVGQNLVLLCYVRGIPTPTITWKKNDKPWRTDRNSHIRFTENDQVVVFAFTKLEDEAKYSCVVANRIARMEKYMNLRFKQSTKNDLTLIGGVVFFALVLLALVIFLVVKIRKERKLRRELTIAGLMHFEEGAVESLNPDLGVDDQADLLPYDKKWEFPREKLKLGKQLGSGAFGVVTKARAYGIVEEEDATTVAVKMVKRNADFIYIKALASELKIMVHLGKHLNVVNLLGACTKNVTKRELFVIVEFCRYGNLHNYLLRHRDNFIDQIDPTTGAIDTSIGAEVLSRTLSVSTTYSGKTDTEPTSPLVPPGGADYRAECTGRRLNSSSSCTADENISMVPSGDDAMITSANTVQPEWRSNYRGDYNGKVRPISTQDLLCWAFQVAHGMEYLASRRVLHGDLAARNILLADNNVVKICDFGLAKSMYKSDNYRKKGDGPLPVKWMAVESIRDRVFSTQSDVWSYGIVLWEFFSLARTPYPGMEADERFYNKLVEGYRMEQPDYATKQIYQIMLECWNARPVQRPSFTDLVVKIGGALEDSVRMHYIDLNNPYLDMNDQTAENGHSDYLAMLSPPDYGNLVSPTYVNNPSIHGDEDDDDDGGEAGSGGGSGGGDTSGGYLCMRPTPAPSAEIFSPRQTNVFNFDRVDGAKDATPTSNGRPNDAAAQTQRPTVKTSYSNPSYQFAPKIDAGEFANEKGLSTGQDNYINVAKCKDAMTGDVETSYKNVDPLASNHYVNDLKV